MIQLIISEIFINPRRDPVCKQSTITHFVDVFNGKTHIYESVYHYVDEPAIDKVLVDKIYLDFDAQDENFFEHTKIIAKYLYDNDIMFYIRFSGRGFHIFIMLDHKWLKNPRMAIRKYVNNLHERMGTSSDPAVIGDLRRLVRIPNTINIKSHKYCIAITYDTLMNNTYEEICELATYKGPCYDYYNGYNLLDISMWDQEIITPVNQNYQVNIGTELSNDIPICIKSMMQNPNLGWRGRTFVIVCLRELGYTKDEIEVMLHNFLTEDKFHHCICDEKQLENLVDNESMLFPSCKTLKEECWCVDEDCQGHNIYY